MRLKSLFLSLIIEPVEFGDFFPSLPFFFLSQIRFKFPSLSFFFLPLGFSFLFFFLLANCNSSIVCTVLCHVFFIASS
ncbi:hypothetical protein TRSA_23100 (plasmid) [Treponema saccharophilum]|uniref:Uncharacterized protein n=1 Tax=Treponema saccharophilum DSM 2985 TaxID=907348 RepID=H7EJG0_9SPIR|nr:hypothetical protein TresaDRAFT_1585 [Treponema saccharophilum DSM 2985]BDC97211.1 hypothetical protein TRSA_23100 [Treponema saccharophilum]